jgi:hypothetical protein
LTAAHSPVAASSAARRIQCPQSATWEAMYPDSEDDEAAREGEAAHWVVSQMLTGHLTDAGMVAPNGVVITPEMEAGADLMFNEATRALEPYGLKPQQGQVEQRVAIPSVHAAHFGTPDYYIVVNRPGAPPLVLLWDYKFGHLPVPAFENAQMVDYLAGICTGMPETTEIQVTIVQPRSYTREGPVRRWSTTLGNMRGLFNRSAAAAAEALGPNPRTRVGPECAYCKARHACPALAAQSFGAMDEAFHATRMDLTPEQIGLELRMLARAEQRLKARKSGLAEQATRLLRQGHRVPGWSMQPGQVREQWTVPAEVVISTGAAMGVKVAKPPEPLTPRQARDAGLDPVVVAALSERGKAAPALTQDDDNVGRMIFGAPGA